MRFGVWHYLSGYVIIDIKGKNLERFLNRVVQSGGDIWHVRRTGSESEGGSPKAAFKETLIQSLSDFTLEFYE